MKLTVLGGSSAFTAAFIDALLPKIALLPHMELVLHGRSRERLELIGGYAQFRLEAFGWSIRTTTAMDEALRDAGVIIHQIRYGGLELRLAGERLAEAVSCHADETLGPAALLTAILLRTPLARTCDCICRHAPRATVINLTNPLSVATSWMHRHGVRSILGACELPLVTAREVADVLEVDFSELTWSYTGLNHRGFLHNLRVKDRCIIASLSDRLAGGALAGIPSQVIAALGAVPTKYFKLLSAPPTAPAPSRSEYLRKLHDDVTSELRCNVSARPPSLERRYLEWYPHAVVPLLVAVGGHEPRPEIVNVVDNDGITRERSANVSNAVVQAIESPQPGEPVLQWLERFERHERTLLGGLVRPTREWLHETIALDPLCERGPENVAEAVWAFLQSEHNLVET